MDGSRFTLLVAVWPLAIGLFAWIRAKRAIRGSGLLYAYLIHFGTLHWLSATMYVFSWARFQDPVLVAAGFEQSTYGLLAFLFGSLLLAPIVSSLRGIPADISSWAEPDTKIAIFYLAAGWLSYVVLLTEYSRLPTVKSIIAGGHQLVVVGLCLFAWRLWQEQHGARVLAVLGLALLLPVFTIINSGFLGYGALGLLIFFVFIGSFYRPRWRFVLVSVLVAYLGLSLYVSYMRDRQAIRDVVWRGAPLEDRLEQVMQTVQTFEWFDPGNVEHLMLVDGRLNQNGLIGGAIERLSMTGDFGYGQTILDALTVVIPRAIWSEKPDLAGSPGVVARYTGFRFSEGTSVGVGQVMELYVNFGTTGVIVGFLVAGCLLALIDQAARRGLERNEWRWMGLWFVIGIGMLQVGGSLTDVLGTAASSVSAILLVNYACDFRLRDRPALRMGRHGERAW